MSNNKPYNAGDESQVRDAKKQVEKVVDAEYESLKFIMSDERGRRFVWWLLEICHLYSLSAINESQVQTFVMEGERSIGLKVIERLHGQHLDDYIRMIREHENKGDS
ncbi:MAG: hypothetical protein N0E44_18910 [Candidatus Thiodiazotropha lotti]|nr:hypothetical protein [Candidatus Thiodiazotropha lotti]MCW4221956.1 hypothetical protein [Candidatus Thiodiazotropha lotti]